MLCHRHYRDVYHQLGIFMLNHSQRKQTRLGKVLKFSLKLNAFFYTNFNWESCSIFTILD